METIRKTSEIALPVIGVALFFVLVYLLSPILSPFFVTASILFLLYPARALPYVRRMMWLTAGFFLIWVYIDLYTLLIPFIIAFILAYIFDPIVDLLDQKGLSRWLSSLIIVVLIVGLIVFFFILLVPIVLAQLKNLVSSVSTFAQDSWNFLMGRRFYTLLQNYGIPYERISQIVSQELPGRLEDVLKGVLGNLIDVVSNISVVIAQVLDFVIIPFVAFYLLWDYPKIVKAVKGVIPAGRKRLIQEYVKTIDEILGDYLRGYLIIMLIQGVIATVVLWILGVNYALLLGIVTAALDLIPYIGLLLPMGLGILAASGSGDPVSPKIIGVIILYVCQHLLESTLLAPGIVGKKIGLHPVVLILSLVVFGHFFGIAGLLMASPTSAVIIRTVKFWREHSVEINGHPAEKTA
ncbi:MAG TPA: AI-2E family transporter [Bacteroidota bacterium]|nr:AI-2E family transporter [Bacteroidota bacterium]